MQHPKLYIGTQVESKFFDCTFTISTFLGCGSHSNTFLAISREKGTEIKVAIKMMLLTTENPLTIARIKQQIDEIMILKHPLVLQIFDYVITGAKLYIIEEFCRYGSVRNYMNFLVDAPVEPVKVLEIVLRTVMILQDMHSKGVPHEAVTASNIMVFDALALRIKLSYPGFPKVRHYCRRIQQLGDDSASTADAQVFITGAPPADEFRADMKGLQTVMFEMLTRHSAADGDPPLPKFFREVLDELGAAGRALGLKFAEKFEGTIM